MQHFSSTPTPPPCCDIASNRKTKTMTKRKPNYLQRKSAKRKPTRFRQVTKNKPTKRRPLTNSPATPNRKNRPASTFSFKNLPQRRPENRRLCACFPPSPKRRRLCPIFVCPAPRLRQRRKRNNPRASPSRRPRMGWNLGSTQKSLLLNKQQDREKTISAICRLQIVRC